MRLCTESTRNENCRTRDVSAADSMLTETALGRLGIDAGGAYVAYPAAGLSAVR